VKNASEHPRLYACLLCLLKALAELRAREATVQEKDELIKLLTKERDQALTTLNRHGLMADRNVEVCNKFLTRLLSITD